MSDISFLYFFLPVFTGLYLITPKALKRLLVILAGAGVIVWADPVGLIPMGICILSGYLFGIFIHNFRDKVWGKVFLGLEITVNAAAFLLFHRTAFDGADFMTLLGQKPLIKSAAAIGASVMPLHSVAYCIDVYKKKYVCEHRFTIVAEYIAFFPTFGAGPILSFDKMKSQFEDPKPSFAKCAVGVRMLMLGLIMKLFISNAMKDMWHDVTDIPLNSMPATAAWLGSLGFAMFFYFEVCAFCCMACGMASLMGIELSYSLPAGIHSKSFRGLCRRANPSLYHWSRNYIYRSIKRDGSGFSEFLAIIFSVMLAVLWYGFSMRSVMFGAALIVVLCFEKILESPLKKLPGFVRYIILFFMILVIMPFMAFSEPAEALQYISAMFGSGNNTLDTASSYLLGSYSCPMITAIVVSFGAFGYLKRKKVFNNEYLTTIIQPVWVIALLIICTAFLVSGENCTYKF
ncbi:MAG: acyltransferase [Ruminococcus sp.]|uniref:MBOAT family O-acyltransferase n=1 Tax=Ruminococcus sp. TaxID=41978 RepID=UPI0025DB7840|nr:MBOAT family O-acyltransferase [Ruminococcus sp.]MBO4865038.1 acyltransferase [Ruminococcus sp.]